MYVLQYVNEKGDKLMFGDRTPYQVQSGIPSFAPLEYTNFYYLSHKGLDGVVAEALLVKSPYQRGQTLIGNNINERVVSIRACLVTETKEEEERLRKQAHSTLSPLLSGTLEIYGETFVKALGDVQIINGPVFEDTDYTEPDGILYFTFQFIAPSNFLTDLNNTMIDLLEVTPRFSFPLEFSPTVLFGDMTSGKTTIINDGDIPAPVIIEIPGPVKTPSVINEATGEFIKIYVPILAGETMYINTSFGNKTVKIKDFEGNEKNAFNYIDLNSTFFQLQVGTNDIQFHAEEGNDTAKVKLYYKRLYLGI